MQKIVLVTGASSNLGASLVTHLIDHNYIVYAGVRDTKKFKSTGDLHYIKLDVNSDSDIKKAVTKIIKEQKRIDVLINCVGLTKVGPTIDFSVEEYQELLNTNSVATFRLAKQIVPVMKNKKGGKIILVTSLNGIVSFPNFGMYSSSKFALDALSESFYYELKKDNISVTAIAPGAIYNPSLTSSNMPHKTAREKFLFLKLLLPMVTQGEVIHTIIDVMESKNPPSRILLGRDAKLVHTMNRILPHRLWNSLMTYIWQKK